MTAPTALTERLTTLEARVAHIRELMDERERASSMRIAELIAHNRVQDIEQGKMVERLGQKIGEIENTLWSGLKWLGTTLVLTLLSIILKVSGLI